MKHDGCIYICDICGEEIKKWNIFSLTKRWCSPGEGFAKCSSDIKVHTDKLIDLCPECMKAIEKLLRANIENKKNKEMT